KGDRQPLRTLIFLLVVYNKAYKAAEKVQQRVKEPDALNPSLKHLITLMDDPETVRAHICVCSIKDRYYKEMKM
ncbi:hypothetical protein ACJX0J_035496, partial [Zea mays]